jgi:simple sugar transport system permease protein
MILTLIDNAFLSIIASAVPASTVIVLCAIGVMLNERVGVLNLGQEGLIAIGAVFAVIAVQTWGIENAWFALLAGMLGAAVMGVIFAFGTVVIRANQVLFGLALALGGVGLANQLGTNRTGSPVPTSSQFAKLDPGGAFSSNQFLEAFFSHDPITYLAYIVVPALLWFLMFRTRHGMIMRSVGESPATADAVGANVMGIRFAYTVLGAAISGAAGAYMVLTITPTWSPDIARGRGWVSLAVVIFAAWRPFRVVAGALLFGALISFEMTSKTRGWDVGFLSAGDMGFLLSMLPYVVTLVAILVPAGAAHLGHRVRATDAPAALATPYFREER